VRAPVSHLLSKRFDECQAKFQGNPHVPVLTLFILLFARAAYVTPHLSNPLPSPL
jgi:hypothetical protein